MKNSKVILIAFLFLSGITIFSLFKYLWSLKEKYDLLDRLNKIKEQVSMLETERQNLLQTLEKEKELQLQLSEENTGLKESLRTSEEKLTQLNLNFTQAQTAIEQLNSEIAMLKTESTSLKEERDNLHTQLIRLIKEKDSFRARLGSLVELKKAIKELKKQVYKVGIDLKQRVATEKVVEGNRGFLFRNGKPTHPAKVKIEVTPAMANQ